MDNPFKYRSYIIWTIYDIWLFKFCLKAHQILLFHFDIQKYIFLKIPDFLYKTRFCDFQIIFIIMFLKSHIEFISNKQWFNKNENRKEIFQNTSVLAEKLSICMFRPLGIPAFTESNFLSKIKYELYLYV